MSDDTKRAAQTHLRIGRWLALLLVCALILFHNDFWNSDPQLESVAGGLPADVAYHLAWVAVATLVLWLVMRVTWKSGP